MYSQYGEEQILKKFLGNKKRGYCVDVGAADCVDVGAADGIINSNSRLLIEMFDWGAILVEPHPTFYSKLEELYKNNEKVTLKNLAVYSHAGRMPFYIYGYDDRAQVSTLSERFKKRVSRIHGNLYEDKPVLVNVTTLEEILKESPQIDFLSIDCEGVDMKVLESNNWNRYRPSLVCVEHSMPIGELNTFMSSINYAGFQSTEGNSFFTPKV